MFAYGGTDRVGDVEALPLEVRWPAFAELLARGRARGRVTRDEFEAALPPGQVSQEDIDEGSAVLEELSIDVVEAERDQTTDDEVPNAAASVARVEEEDDTGPTTVDTALLGRTDDPGPHLPSRDGQRRAPDPRRRDRGRPAHRGRARHHAGGARREPDDPRHPDRLAGRRRPGPPAAPRGDRAGGDGRRRARGPRRRRGRGGGPRRPAHHPRRAAEARDPGRLRRRAGGRQEAAPPQERRRPPVPAARSSPGSSRSCASARPGRRSWSATCAP